MSEPGDEELERDDEVWTPDGSPLDRATFNADGLLPAIIQDDGTGDVLMLGWMDREAMRRTLTEGRVTFWSRSRQEYWRKGDTSGHVQYVRAAALDCLRPTRNGRAQTSVVSRAVASRRRSQPADSTTSTVSAMRP